MPIFFLIQLILVLCLIILFLIVFAGIETFSLGFIPTLVISIFLTYFLSLLILAGVHKLSRLLMRTKEGDIEGIGVVLWTIQATTLDIALTLTQKLMIHSILPDFVYRLFGFKRRKGVSILTKMWDPDLLDIGENTLIGTDTIISGHQISEGRLYRKKVIVGKNVSIGGLCIIGPGVTIGDNTIVGFGSSVPPNWTLDSDSLYSGVPVKKIRSLKDE